MSSASEGFACRPQETQAGRLMDECQNVTIHFLLDAASVKIIQGNNK